MKTSLHIPILAILLMLLWATPIFSQQINWKVVEDINGKYNLERIMTEAADLPVSNKQIFNFSYATYPVWLIAELQGNTDQKLFIENPTIGYLDIYLMRDGNIIRQFQTGNYRKVSTRDFNHPGFIFDIPASAESTTIVIKAQSNEPLIIPLNVIKEDLLSSYLFKHDIIGLIVTGILLSLITLYLIIFISLRETSYLLYLLFAATILITILRLNGYTSYWLWPNSPIFNQFPAIQEALPAITAGIFAIYYLRLRKYYPIIYKLIVAMIGIQVLVIPVTLLGFGNSAIIICETVALLYMPIITVVSAMVFLQKEYRPAKYFLISSIFLFTGSVIYILINFNVLETTNIFFRNSIQIGIALEMTFLAIGVSKKIDRLRKEHAEIQAENVKILSEKKDELKLQVAQQTADLQAQNQTLENTIEQLKSTQYQLVKSEKLAAIGTLTAGIAHEINNPINYIQGGAKSVKSNVSEILQFDQLMEESMEKILKYNENNQLNGAKIMEMMERIYQEKKALDYDELIAETYSLLDDIHEGANKTSEIVEGLRTISRVNNDKFSKNDLNKDLSITISLLKKQLEKINLETKLEEGMNEIEYAPGLMSQVFLIILNNSIAAIEDDGTIKVQTTSTDDNHVEISFADNGHGIPEEIHHKVFDPFFTTKPVGSGTGIGLSIAKSIIDNHHGSISFTSSEQNGTNFIIRIPKIQPENEAT